MLIFHGQGMSAHVLLLRDFVGKILHALQHLRQPVAPALRQVLVQADPLHEARRNRTPAPRQHVGRRKAVAAAPTRRARCRRRCRPKTRSRRPSPRLLAGMHEHRALATLHAVAFLLQHFGHRRQLTADVDQILDTSPPNRPPSRTPRQSPRQLRRGWRRPAADRSLPRSPARRRAAWRCSTILSSVSANTSTSSSVLYMANEARAVPAMPKRSMSGWQQ